MPCRLDIYGPRAIVVIDRPAAKNAMTDEMWAELGEILRDLTRRAEPPRVLVIEGAGEDFCAGADLWIDESAHPTARLRLANDVAYALHRLPIPTIAKVRGVSIGAGCNLAIGCDFVAAAASAVFSEIFVRRGLTLDFGGSWLLPRLVGHRAAKRLALLGEKIDAPEAARLGMITEAVPDALLDDVVDRWAEQLVSAPPLAVASIKKLLDESMSSSMAVALSAEEYAQSLMLTTDDFAEAVTAFTERREPRFQGR